MPSAVPWRPGRQVRAPARPPRAATLSLGAPCHATRSLVVKRKSTTSGTSVAPAWHCMLPPAWSLSRGVNAERIAHRLALTRRKTTISTRGAPTWTLAVPGRAQRTYPYSEWVVGSPEFSNTILRALCVHGGISYIHLQARQKNPHSSMNPRAQLAARAAFLIWRHISAFRSQVRARAHRAANSTDPHSNTLPHDPSPAYRIVGADDCSKSLRARVPSCSNKRRDWIRGNPNCPRRRRLPGQSVTRGFFFRGPCWNAARRRVGGRERTAPPFEFPCT